MAYLESNLKTELVKAFEAAGHVCHRFPDLAKGVKKPHDLVCGIHGHYVGIETKLVKVGTVSSVGHWRDTLIVVRHTDVRPNQHVALKETVRRKSIGLVVAGIYDRCDHHRLAFALTYEQFLTRDVWTYGDCVREGVRIPWERGKGWDISGLVEVIGTQLETP